MGFTTKVDEVEPAQPSRHMRLSPWEKPWEKPWSGCKLTWLSGTRDLGGSHFRGMMMEGREGDVLVVNAFPAHATSVGQEEGTTWSACQGSSSHRAPLFGAPTLEGPIVLVDWPFSAPL